MLREGQKLSNPREAIADRGYDSVANHHALWDGHGIIPIIHIRRSSNGETLQDGLYTTKGVPTCLGMVPMKYVGTDKKARYVYRCREEGCELNESNQGGVRHYDTIYRQDPLKNIGLFGVIRRNGRRWKNLYKKRQAIERIFKNPVEINATSRQHTTEEGIMRSLLSDE